MEAEEHLLALKVMRLTRPTLASPLPVTCDSKDLPGNLLNNVLQQDPTAVPGSETIAIGQFLLLPQNPVDLQTTSQKLSLANNSSTTKLNSDETVNTVIHHEVKEIGPHILVCEVAYQNSAGVLMSFRKFFKIQVLKPLDVKTKFYNAENDDVYLEAQVQNITNGPICLEKVSLDASHLFNGIVTCLNNTPTGESIFGNITLLQPQSISQYLYCLTPTDKLSSDLKSLSGATNIGKLDIVWRSNLGEKGRLQTSQLQRMSPDFGEIKLSITELPNFVVIEELFTFKCKLANNGERTVEFILYLENTRNIAWCGISGRKLEALPPHSSKILEFKCIPLVPGLRTLSGVKLVDTFTKRTYTYDELGQVFVILSTKTSS
ncbi:hypothetical protein HUJ05_013192 [Dendroctonus ponderosae]|nr:hypothetical protein HUJ05_013192 [Dendroctonus ponderosae]